MSFETKIYTYPWNDLPEGRFYLHKINPYNLKFIRPKSSVKVCLNQNGQQFVVYEEQDSSKSPHHVQDLHRTDILILRQ